MENIEKFVESPTLLYLIFLFSPCFYPYIAKGNIPYKDEDAPDAAVLVVALEGAAISVLIDVLLAVPWLYFFNMPFKISLIIMPPCIIISCLTFHFKYRMFYGTKIKIAGMTSYVRRRYSWIINRRR